MKATGLLVSLICHIYFKDANGVQAKCEPEKKRSLNVVECSSLSVCKNQVTGFNDNNKCDSQYESCGSWTGRDKVLTDQFVQGSGKCRIGKSVSRAGDSYQAGGNGSKTSDTVKSVQTCELYCKSDATCTAY